MTERVSGLSLAIVAALVAAMAVPRDAGAVPIAYSFAGEMTSFTPPVSDPGEPPPPVPQELRFFTGSFVYDPGAGGSGAVSEVFLAFADGPTVDGPVLTTVPQTFTNTQARIGGTDSFLVSLAVRMLAPDGGFPEVGLDVLFERPLAGGDQDGVLPPTLDGFIGSFIGASLPAQIFVSGTVTELNRSEAVAMPEPSALMVLAVALGLWLLRSRSRKRAHVYP